MDGNGRFVGECKHCKRQFRSRRPKIFCSVQCYVTFPETMNRLAFEGKKATENRLGGKISLPELWRCLNCGKEEIRTLAHQKMKKYCSKVCYREYMAGRFDRFIANPETIKLPQCYDEFLDREELPCLVEGCTWKGKALSNHVNFSHGITAAQFKELVGFNNKTGLVSKDMAKHLADRWQQWNGPPSFMGQPPPRTFKPIDQSKIRLEGKEHIAKARALNAAKFQEAAKRLRATPEFRLNISRKQQEKAKLGTGAFSKVEVSCTVCGATFTTNITHAKRDVRLCSRKCINKWHNERYVQRRIWECVCAFCGCAFKGAYGQFKSHKKGMNVFCGAECLSAHRSTWHNTSR